MARIYQPLEITRDGQPTGRYHMTVASDEERWVHSVGYCAQDCPGHATPEEAVEHWYDYLADRMIARKSNTNQERCFVCGQWTQNVVTAEGGDAHLVILCDEHATKEHFRQQLKNG